MSTEAARVRKGTAVSDRSALSANRIRRAGGVLVGVLLFYAPFALMIKFVAFLAPATAPGRSISDVHTACLRMPIGRPVVLRVALPSRRCDGVRKPTGA